MFCLFYSPMLLNLNYHVQYSLQKVLLVWTQVDFCCQANICKYNFWNQHLNCNFSLIAIGSPTESNLRKTKTKTEERNTIDYLSLSSTDSWKDSNSNSMIVSYFSLTNASRHAICNWREKFPRWEASANQSWIISIFNLF